MQIGKTWGDDVVPSSVAHTQTDLYLIRQILGQYAAAKLYQNAVFFSTSVSQLVVGSLNASTPPQTWLSLKYH